MTVDKGKCNAGMTLRWRAYSNVFIWITHSLEVKANNLVLLQDLYIDRTVLTEVRLLYVLFSHDNMREQD